MSIESRKQDHIDLCLNQNVDSSEGYEWSEISLPHCACPNQNLSEITLSTTVLNQNYQSPFLISSMTGGTPAAFEINLRLAQLSQDAQIPMGVGSQRIAIENPAIEKDFKLLKKEFPGSRLWANIGLVQLNYGVNADNLNRLCELIEAEALIFHLNPLQEALQKEGDTNFKGLLKQLEAIRPKIKIPFVVKETGCGIDPVTAKTCFDIGVDAIDVAGMGGSHWGYIEGLRDSHSHEVASWFRNWGTSTAKLLPIIKKAHPNCTLIASGGIKNGVDAAKSIYLGASLAGLAKPYLMAASQGLDTLFEFQSKLERALKISLFCSNHGSVDALRSSNHVIL